MRAWPLLLLAASCGYTFVRDRGPRLATEDSAALPKIAVVPFDNATFRRGLEVRLTTLLADELRGRGQPVERPGQADWVLDGTIVDARERVISEDRRDNVRESSFLVTVSVVLKDPASGRTLGTYSLTRSEPFSDRAGRVATLEQAREEVLRDLAEAIVYWLEDRNVD